MIWLFLSEPSLIGMQKDLPVEEMEKLMLTNLQASDEDVKAAWSEVVNQYKRRADLIPNLVSTVEGYAKQERDVLIAVTQARSRVGSVQVTPETVNDPAAFQNFNAAQDQLSSALSRLLVQQMGGRIEVNSSNAGSEFKLWLRLAGD